MASPAAAAASCDGSRLAVPATAMPIAAVPKSRRRSWLIASVVLLVSMGALPVSMVLGCTCRCRTSTAARSKWPVRRCETLLAAASDDVFVSGFGVPDWWESDGRAPYGAGATLDLKCAWPQGG